MPQSPSRLTRPPLSFWQRAEWARQEGLITWGALAYLRTLARLARSRGDGRSFVLGERVIEEVTGISRINCRRWRKQLADAGLITFDRRWSHKRGWFWEARTSLVFDAASGLKMSPEGTDMLPGSKRAQSSGLKKSPSLIRDAEPTVKGKGRRGKPRRTVARQHGPAPTPQASTSAPGATTASETAAAKVKEAPHPGAPPAAAQTADVQGSHGPVTPPAPAVPPVDPHRIIPPEEAARRIRELIARLRHVAKPAPTDHPETH